MYITENVALTLNIVRTPGRYQRFLVSILTLIHLTGVFEKTVFSPSTFLTTGLGRFVTIPRAILHTITLQAFFKSAFFKILLAFITPVADLRKFVNLLKIVSALITSSARLVVSRCRFLEALIEVTTELKQPLVVIFKQIVQTVTVSTTASLGRFRDLVASLVALTQLEFRYTKTFKLIVSLVVSAVTTRLALHRKTLPVSVTLTPQLTWLVAAFRKIVGTLTSIPSLLRTSRFYRQFAEVGNLSVRPVRKALFGRVPTASPVVNSALMRVVLFIRTPTGTPGTLALTSRLLLPVRLLIHPLSLSTTLIRRLFMARLQVGVINLLASMFRIASFLRFFTETRNLSAITARLLMLMRVPSVLLKTVTTTFRTIFLTRTIQHLTTLTLFLDRLLFMTFKLVASLTPTSLVNRMLHFKRILGAPRLLSAMTSKLIYLFRQFLVSLPVVVTIKIVSGTLRVIFVSFSLSITVGRLYRAIKTFTAFRTLSTSLSRLIVFGRLILQKTKLTLVLSVISKVFTQMFRKVEAGTIAQTTQETAATTTPQTSTDVLAPTPTKQEETAT